MSEWTWFAAVPKPLTGAALGVTVGVVAVLLLPHPASNNAILLKKVRKNRRT
jgi:hypothetical protein